MASQPIDIVDARQISERVPQRIYTAIGRAIAEWSKLDHVLAEALASLAGGEWSKTSIIIGRMEVRNKIERMIAILNLEPERKQEMNLARAFRKNLAPFQDARNHFAHGFLVGKHKPTGRFIFAVPKYFIDDDVGAGIRTETYSIEEIERFIEAAQQFRKAALGLLSDRKDNIAENIDRTTSPTSS